MEASAKTRSREAKGAQPGLRARKAAQTRLAILDSLAERLVEQDLPEISADALAADANVSRMTFFNYFPSKADAVDLLLVRWIYEQQLTLMREGLRGAAGIERLFALHGDWIAENGDLMRRLFALHCQRPCHHDFPGLTDAERLQIAGDELGWEEVEPLGRQFMRLAQEARDDGLHFEGSPYELSHMLGSIYNGMAMTGRSSEDTDYRQLARRHVRRALGLLGSGEGPDPRAPKTPTKYRSNKRKKK